MKNILDFFENTVSNCPDNLAVSDGKDELSFCTLHTASRGAASALLNRGYRNEAVVIFMKKSARAICALISSIYAGLYYVPVDENIPSMRRKQILKAVSRGLYSATKILWSLCADIGDIDAEILFDDLLSEKEDRFSSIR